MKIIIILSVNPFYAASATANRWLSLIQGLNKLGTEIRILIYGHYQTKEEKVICGKQYDIEEIAIKYVNYKLADSLWKRRYYKYIGKHVQSIKTHQRIKKEILDFDGIVWPENDITIWKIVSKISNRSFKLICEMSEFLDIHDNNKGSVLQIITANPQLSYFEKTYIQKLDGLVLMTKTLVAHYNTFSQHPPLLHLPMTVDLDRFIKPKSQPYEFKKPYIAFVGVMNDAKDGVNILIEAFSKIYKDYPSLKLYLVGGWNYDTPGHQVLINQLKLEGCVRWVGEYPRDAIPAIICNAKLLVLPRPDSKQAQGGFPTKLGEYLASGRPVCATAVGEIPEYLTDCKSVYFAKPGSVRSFIKAMSNALKDDGQANNVGEQGKKAADLYFNKNKQSKRLYNFLEEFQNENKR